MKDTTIHMYINYLIREEEPRIFNDYLEHIGHAVDDGVNDPNTQTTMVFEQTEDGLNTHANGHFGHQHT